MERRQVLASGAAAFGVAMSGTGAGAALPEGFYVPAEDVAHERTFMMWPESRRVYRDGWFLEQVQETILRLANTIAEFEPVTLLAHADAHALIGPGLAGGVTLWDVPTEDLWARDAGPIFAKGPGGARAVSHIRFNGWGAKQVHAHDGAVAERVAERLGLPLIEAGLRGEAGGVEQDGHGLLMAHESSWVTESRNPGLSRAEVGARLLDAYGADEIVWTPGLEGEDITDYHIDSLARFTGPGRVLMNLPDTPDPGDPFHNAALETEAILRDAGLEIEIIPEPNRRRVDSYDFVASYVNFYVCNGAVIGAEFGDAETDALAADALARHFPGREVVLIEADALGELGGGIHCATKEMPA